MAQIDIKDAVFEILDGGTGSAQKSIEVTVGEGNLTYSEAVTREYILDRGNLDEVRDGDQVPMNVSFQFKWDYIEGGSSSGAVPTIEDALKRRGPASAWVSSDSDACRPYAVDLRITYTPACSSGDKEVILLPDFRYESLEHDLRAGQISCSGKCNATEATATRSAQ